MSVCVRVHACVWLPSVVCVSVCVRVSVGEELFARICMKMGHRFIKMIQSQPSCKKVRELEEVMYTVCFRNTDLAKAMNRNLPRRPDQHNTACQKFSKFLKKEIKPVRRQRILSYRCAHCQHFEGK
ncbi:hypothetical protein EVAR_8343_1 [Eumeta japonica]|uniref:Uncharacterized protein n=1 Tax=Eumeta variegata TaxID=151549 RepID=A0A4C1VD98_EUMVA|nr:hypothetical protein EVAR_8343_1 [Eumeta japonica]